jgi:riboflavin synthase
MFTGIIEEMGTVARLERRGRGARLQIGCKKVLEDAFEGASIAVNGVCLTAVDIGAGHFHADCAPETMSRTNLGDLAAGAAVNLERPLSPGGRLGGHIVQGHVDATGVLLELEAIGNENWWLTVQVPEALDRYLVEKGSVAIDGISLTVARIEKLVMSVTIIPHTYASTTLGRLRSGARVNLETDILAKYVEKMAVARGRGLTVERLEEEGY